ncbi:hypothetical protein NDU88_004385 [Pleurodeles waltl]|uniref:Uncharacterized protein n=1 Tax=Pleurodeles waltl TaxID=8319 RepID=A0AAV7PFH5_PLEWA|nr:hypothetical protein NDU88_004385 [Pleurodeles waltl]
MHPRKTPAGSCMMQKISDGVKIFADMISCWKSPTSFGYDKSAFCIKMALDGSRRDLGVSTLCEEEEGALSTLESPRDATPGGPRTRGQRRCKLWLMQHNEGRSYAAGEQLSDLSVTGWSAGDLGQDVHEGLLERVQRPQEVKKTQYTGVLSLSGKARSYLFQIASPGPQDSLCR